MRGRETDGVEEIGRLDQERGPGNVSDTEDGPHEKKGRSTCGQGAGRHEPRSQRRTSPGRDGRDGREGGDDPAVPNTGSEVPGEKR